MSLYNFYRSKEWLHLLDYLKSTRVDEQGYIICEYCGKPIVKAYDCIGHHKEPLTENNYIDRCISLNPENIMLIHHRCHNMIHNKLSYSNRQIFVVWGAPLSGKITYVQEAITPGDLIVDMDNIWQCVSGQERYIKPNRLKSTVFSVRDLLIENIRTRSGKWMNAYIIGGYPMESERERLINMLGAREIYIDADYQSCVDRLLTIEDTRDKEQWKSYIDDWFRKFNNAY